MNVVWNAALVSLGVSAVLSPAIMAGLRALKSKQVISKHLSETHQRKAGTPNMGGFIALVGILGALVYLALEGSSVAFALGAMLLVGGFTLVGFFDDFVIPRMKPGSRGIPWIPKLLLQVFAGIGATYVAGYHTVASMVIVTILLLFYCNAYNFSDGLDALAGSLGVLLGLALGTMAVLRGEVGPAALCFAICAGLLSFLAWNRPPAKVFMGDTGSLPIGALFAFAGVAVAHPAQYERSFGWANFFNAPVWAILVLSFVMLAEIVPVPLQIFWVKVFKRRLFPFTPIHHAFEKAGWPETKVVGLFAVVQVLSAIAALGLLYALGGASVAP